MRELKYGETFEGICPDCGHPRYILRFDSHPEIGLQRITESTIGEDMCSACEQWQGPDSTVTPNEQGRPGGGQ